MSFVINFIWIAKILKHFNLLLNYLAKLCFFINNWEKL
jgi:hypothetical protein